MSKKIWGEYYDGDDYEDDEDPFSGEYDFLNQEDIIGKSFGRSHYSEEKRKILEEILRRDEGSICKYLANEGHCRIIHQKNNGDADFPFQPNLKNLIIYCTEPLRAPSCKRYLK